MGEAAQPALKELISISKEEKKLKADLRKERNAQKRADYSDKIAKLGMALKFQSADLDNVKAFTDLRHKEKMGEISEANAKLQREKFLNNKAVNNFKLSELKLLRKMTDKGQFYVKDIMTELKDLSKSMAKTAVQGGIHGATSAMATRAYRSQLPAIYERYRGKVIRDGKILTDKELAGIISPPVAKPGTTVNVTGAGGATVTMGSNTDGD